MIEGLQYRRETIELNKEFLAESKEDTNDLVVADLLKELGYDRKRSNKIQKLRGASEYSWMLTTVNGGHLFVKVFSLNDPKIETEDGQYKSDDENLVGVIVTDGIKLKLFDANYPGEAPAINIDILNSDDKVIEYAFDILSTTSDIEGYLRSLHKRTLEEIVKEAINKKDTSIFSDDFFRDQGIDDISNIYNLFISENNNSEELETLKTEVNKLQDKYESANKECESLKYEVDKLNKQLSELPETDSNPENPDLSEMNKTIASLTSDLRMKDKAIDGYNETIDELRRTIEEKDKNIQELHDKLVKASDESNDSSISDRSYRLQIEQMTNDITHLKEELANKDEEIKSLQDKMANKVDPKVIAAKDLIDAVEDNPELPRSYVGVVNGNLFQAQTLEKFIGLALQELYSCVSFELMPFLFDGDIFKLSDRATRKDMIIGNRVFDIDLSNITEEDSMLRLKTLFGKFPSIIFFEKSIGTITTNEESYSDAEDNFNNNSEDLEDVGNSENEAFEEFPNSTDENFDNQCENSEVIIDEENSVDFGDSDNSEITGNLDNDGSESIEIPDFTSGEDNNTNEAGFNEDSGDYKSEDLAEDLEEPKVKEGCLSFAIADLGNVLWSDECHLEEPMYIMNSSDVLKLRNDCFRDQIQSIIYSLLLFSPNYTEAVNNMRRIDFKSISNKIVEHPSETSIRIPYTKYLIEADNIGMVLPIISKICEVAMVDTTVTNIVFSGSTKVPGIFADYFINVDEFNFETVDEANFYEENSEYEAGTSDRDLHCIISASIINAVVMNKEQIDVQSNIIKKCIAIRTNYITHQMTNEDDVAYIVTEILANSESPLEDVLSKVGNIIGEQHKFISMNSEDVGPDYITAHLNGDDYYIANTEEWKLLYSLIQLHGLCTGNNSISIRVILDKKLYDFYNTNFVEFDPVKMAAVKSFIIYASDRLK